MERAHRYPGQDPARVCSQDWGSRCSAACECPCKGAASGTLGSAMAGWEGAAGLGGVPASMSAEWPLAHLIPSCPGKGRCSVNTWIPIHILVMLSALCVVQGKREENNITWQSSNQVRFCWVFVFHPEDKSIVQRISVCQQSKLYLHIGNGKSPGLCLHQKS